MKKILILKGLPGSGKTTFALELLKKEPSKWKRVNKDELRVMVDGGKWSRANEEYIIKIRNLVIFDAVSEGFNVIVDDTNFESRHEEAIRKVAGTNAAIEIKTFNTPLEVCIERDAKRVKPVGEKVIRGMYERYIKPNEPKIEPPKNDPNLQDVILVDIDGTLSLMNGRTPFEWNRVGEDLPNKPIIDLVKTIIAEKLDYSIIVVSGRDEICRMKTSEWLLNNQIYYRELFMRPEGDNRKDAIVKKEIYENHLKGRYNVRLVFDDRDQVVALWRSLGLTCLQVADGKF